MEEGEEAYQQALKKLEEAERIPIDPKLRAEYNELRKAHGRAAV